MIEYHQQELWYAICRLLAFDGCNFLYIGASNTPFNIILDDPITPILAATDILT